MDSSELLRGRAGEVSSWDDKTLRARVLFRDKNNLVSGPLPLLVDNADKNREERHLDVGERVFCVFLGNGHEMGFILGSYYDENNPPTVGDRNRWVKIFKDGTHFLVDRERHIVQVKDSFDSFTLMKDGKITLQSADIIDLNPGTSPESLHLTSQFD